MVLTAPEYFIFDVPFPLNCLDVRGFTGILKLLHAVMRERHDRDSGAGGGAFSSQMTAKSHFPLQRKRAASAMDIHR